MARAKKRKTVANTAENNTIDAKLRDKRSKSSGDIQVRRGLKGSTMEEHRKKRR